MVACANKLLVPTREAYVRFIKVSARTTASLALLIVQIGSGTQAQEMFVR